MQCLVIAQFTVKIIIWIEFYPGIVYKILGTDYGVYSPSIRGMSIAIINRRKENYKMSKSKHLIRTNYGQLLVEVDPGEKQSRIIETTNYKELAVLNTADKDEAIGKVRRVATFFKMRDELAKAGIKLLIEKKQAVPG